MRQYFKHCTPKCIATGNNNQCTNKNEHCLSGSLPTKRAAMGAAIKPPMINPAICNKGISFNKMKKVMELVNTTKNSARQTEPIT